MYGVLVFLGLFFEFSEGLNNGLALTPPMGWMSWERYRCITDCKTYPDECISENLFKRAADKMASDGYLDAGYEYVIIDDCWLAKERDSDGKLQPDKDRFPNGIKNLAAYVHSKGLKFGIYEDYGNKTCGGYPGILGHLKEDAETFASWDVDYIKLDGCYSSVFDMDKGYREFGEYLNKTGRPIVYSCSLPAYQEEASMEINYPLLVEICNIWRNYDDIGDSYHSMMGIVDYFAAKQEYWPRFAGPGHWNDPDMLIIGNYGLSLDQSKAQMALWAIMAAPLLMSVNFDTIRPEFKAVLLNKLIIEVNQDPLGKQGKRIYRQNQIEVWRREVTPVQDGYPSLAFAFVSRRDDGSPYALNITIDKIGCANPAGYQFYDLYNSGNGTNSILLKSKDALQLRINPTGVMFFKATSVKNSTT